MAKPASLPNLFRAYNGNGKYRKKSALEGTVAKDRVHDSYSNPKIHLFSLTVLQHKRFLLVKQMITIKQYKLFKCVQIHMENPICSHVFNSAWRRLFVRIHCGRILFVQIHMEKTFCSNPMREKIICSNPHGEDSLFKSVQIHMEKTMRRIARKIVLT